MSLLPRYPCPHCGEPSIPFGAKWLSGNIRMAQCPECGGFSQVRYTTARQCGAAALAVAGLAVLAFVFWQLHPAWLAVGGAAAGAAYLLAWHLCGLEAAETGGWKLGRDWLFSLLAFALLGVWWFGRNG